MRKSRIQLDIAWKSRQKSWQKISNPAFDYSSRVMARWTLFFSLFHLLDLHYLLCFDLLRDGTGVILHQIKDDTSWIINPSDSHRKILRWTHILWSLFYCIGEMRLFNTTVLPIAHLLKYSTERCPSVPSRRIAGQSWRSLGQYRLPKKAGIASGQR
jgi:hypothetical protein